MDQKSGVFSPCENMDSVSMIQCLQALHGAYPTIKFHSITIDKKNKGFKALFIEQDISVILRKNMLSSDGHPVWIYPLTSYLVMRVVDKKKNPLFERDLRVTIEKNLGRVLGILKTNNTWRIEIDVPEFKGSNVFKGGFISMNIVIPIRNERVDLKFWCRECKEPGHFQHECPTRANTEPNGENTASNGRSEKNNTEQNENNVTSPVSPPSDQISEGKSRTKSKNTSDLLRQQACSSSDQNCENIPDLLGQQNCSSSDQNSPNKPKSENISDFINETTERLAQIIGAEEASSFGKEMEKHTQNTITVNARASTSSNLFTEKDIKRENEELTQTVDGKENTNPGSEIPDNNNHFEDRTCKNDGNKNFGFSSEVDDEIEIIECAGNSSFNKSPSNASNSSVKAGYGNFEEESKSPEAKPTTFSDCSSPATAGPSNESLFTTLPSPRGAEVTTALSERLQDCINQVCNTIGVLDRKKLDAFLIHVKKKSNPIRVALNYTKNTKGLKEQLQGILHMYYNTPQTGTKEDIQFIKWLNGLVDRYDGSIPKKRKRTGKTEDEPTAKK